MEQAGLQMVNTLELCFCIDNYVDKPRSVAVVTNKSIYTNIQLQGVGVFTETMKVSCKVFMGHQLHSLKDFCSLSLATFEVPAL